MVKSNIWDGALVASSRLIKWLVVHTQAGYGGVPSIEAARKGNGWKVGGYHFYIMTDGTIHYLYDISTITNGVGGKNSNCIHVCYEGGVKGADGLYMDTRTQAQKIALLEVLQALKNLHPEAEILGHRDLSPDLNGNGIIEPFEWVKSCPNFDARPEYAHIKKQTNEQVKRLSPSVHSALAGVPDTI